MLKSILILFFLLVVSCSPYTKDDNQIDPNLYKNNTLSDQELFELANDHISNDRFETALIELDKIEVLFPSSKYSAKSILLSAYIHFIRKDYEKTRALSENFKSYYPGNIDIVYANYLEAMTYYVLIKKSDYSPKNAEIALEKFIFILNAYPNNKYEIDIITKIKIINNNLAKSKLEKAKFYMNKDNYNGALVYLLDIFESHNSSAIITETLYLLSKIYYDIDEIEISKSYASILAYNFPNSSWYNEAYKLIYNHDDIKNDVKWFEKYNPLNILIDDEKKISNDSNIQTLK